ncbi:MAG TPA: GNAT family N-acetyltransferase [Acidimicrobiia bacterium]
MEAARRANVDDLGTLLELAAELRAELVPMRGGSLWSRTAAYPEPLDATFRALIEQDDACVLVGTIDEVVVGFGVCSVAVLRDGTRLGQVTELFVTADARSVSVGEGLLTLLVDWCRDQGCVGIDAFALPGHRAAKNFFETAGFTARALLMHHELEQ